MTICSAGLLKEEIKQKILNQLRDHGHFDAKIVYNEKIPRMYSCMPGGGRKVGGWGFNRLISHSSVRHNPVKNTQHPKDGQVGHKSCRGMLPLDLSCTL